MSTVAVASAIASAKLRSSRAGSKPCGSKRLRRPSSAARTSGHHAWARTVGSTPPGTVTKSSSPVASRSRRRALLTAGWVIASCVAARVTLRSTMTAAKTRSRLRSSVRKFKDSPAGTATGSAFTAVMAGSGIGISNDKGKP